MSDFWKDMVGEELAIKILKIAEKCDQENKEIIKKVRYEIEKDE